MIRQIVDNDIKSIVDLVDFKSFVNFEYEFIYERGLNEYKITCDLLNKQKMYFNEIRYTKLVVHFMFISILSKYTDDKNQLKAQEIFSRMKESENQFNCFIDNIYLFDNPISFIKT
jgi:hypothetical protein